MAITHEDLERMVIAMTAVSNIAEDDMAEGTLERDSMKTALGELYLVTQTIEAKYDLISENLFEEAIKSIEVA